MKIVGFIGKKGAGKDTAADILVDNKKVYGKLFFAKPLKIICSKLFGVHPTMLSDPSLKEYRFKTPIILDKRTLRKVMNEVISYVPEFDFDNQRYRYRLETVSLYGVENRQVRTPRELMQVIGSDFIRNKIYENWHIEAAFSKKNLNIRNKSGIYAITDIRFINELKFLQETFKESFIPYFVERPSSISNDLHISEVELESIKPNLNPENILINDGSLEDFKEKVLSLTLPSQDLDFYTLIGESL